jgi:hypothetical protein
MLAYARSGGTLINRCIACLPDVIMLSEVNIEASCPSSCNSIKEQAKEWYGIALESDGFMENIKELYDHCLRTGKLLVIRDWTFGSFVPSRYNYFKPSKTLATLDILSERFPIKAFVLVRNSIDIWLSLNASPRTFYDKKLTYLHELITCVLNRGIKIFRYEDFCDNPERKMHSICNFTGLKYSDQFKNFADFHKVTGDTDLPNHSRGIKRGNIGLLQRRKVSDDILEEITTGTRALAINKLLGYQDSLRK